MQSLGEIPRALPTPTMPNLSLVAGLMVPAIAIALVGLIQSAGVSKGTPNSDGTYPDMNRDFIGQGLGNAASGVFGGMPIGGSVSSTALVVQLGAKSRIANFIVGPIIAVVVLLFSGAVEMIPLATLAGLLVVIGRPGHQAPAPSRRSGRRASRRAPSWSITFVAVLMMPIQYAVLLGVVLSILQYVYSSSLDVRVVELVRDRRWDLRRAARTGSRSPTSQVTVLDIYGSVFYAGADIIGGLLPEGHRLAPPGRRHCGCAGAPTSAARSSGSSSATVARSSRPAASCCSRASVPKLRDQLERTGVLAPSARTACARPSRR